jgi:transposase
MSREELLALVAQLQGQIADLTTTIEALRAENDKLQRNTKRQAAPFSKGSRVSQPKRPGRKPGSGAFSFRQAPQPGEITEPPVVVPVTVAACPD